jgi:hypothetical protein
MESNAMEQEEEPIVTVEILREVAAEALAKAEGREPDELLGDWLRWFRKKSDRYIRDAVQRGYYEMVFDLPYKVAKGGLQGRLFARALKEVRRLMPGCQAHIVEEEDADDTPIYRVLVSWREVRPAPPAVGPDAAAPLAT